MSAVSSEPSLNDALATLRLVRAAIFSRRLRCDDLPSAFLIKANHFLQEAETCLEHERDFNDDTYDID